MTVQEFLTRFPQIPAVLHGEPFLERYMQAFGRLFETAREPSACGASQQTADNVAFMKLIAPLTFMNFGLATREQTVADAEKLLAAYEADPQRYLAELIPSDVARTPGGCEESRNS